MAAPVRSAAPVRRRQSLISGLDHSKVVAGLRFETFLYWYRDSVEPWSVFVDIAVAASTNDEQ
ncbi:MAG: hypothetical protein K2Q25_07825 [Mycobacteriaceae bacterium]|nr:hypothetical protein [Mycobacteriaceae bacterium]